ncbi:hypothetical protein ATANTOWER_029909 [Ataeniobius toweri]|uniref:Uncharacterized protein n=1 Tax=Ataeniobius toweri TaxID=208326 RepID=A0ABU7BVA4_9TELE|nr:hypothetical protein [Ataeniobius toweri]
MAHKRKMTVFEALEQLWNNSDAEIEESSDSSEISEAEEEEEWTQFTTRSKQDRLKLKGPSLPPLRFSLYLLL